MRRPGVATGGPRCRGGPRGVSLAAALGPRPSAPAGPPRGPNCPRRWRPALLGAACAVRSPRAASRPAPPQAGFCRAPGVPCRDARPAPQPRRARSRRGPSGTCRHPQPPAALARSAPTAPSPGGCWGMAAAGWEPLRGGGACAGSEREPDAPVGRAGAGAAISAATPQGGGSGHGPGVEGRRQRSCPGPCFSPRPPGFVGGRLGSSAPASRAPARPSRVSCWAAGSGRARAAEVLVAREGSRVPVGLGSDGSSFGAAAVL